MRAKASFLLALRHQIVRSMRHGALHTKLVVKYAEKLAGIFPRCARRKWPEEAPCGKEGGTGAISYVTGCAPAGHLKWEGVAEYSECSGTEVAASHR